MTSTGIILILLVAGFTIYLGIWLKQKTNTRMQEAEKRTANQTLLYKDRSANFFGQASRGYTQIRGNGILLITNNDIYFDMWVPNRKLFIPVQSIISYETTKSFLGKTKLCPLIQINFYNETGESDSAAWLTRDLTLCIKVLDDLL